MLGRKMQVLPSDDTREVWSMLRSESQLSLKKKSTKKLEIKTSAKQKHLLLSSLSVAHMVRDLSIELRTFG